jgi:hypothetical protein
VSNKIAIYALTDPNTGCVRYVGKSKDLDYRVRYGHLGSELRKASLHKSRWLRKLASVGLKPTVEVLEWADEAEWQERERHWIAHYRALGAPLTNMTDGGDGGCITHTPETRKKMSDGRKGKSRGKEFCETMRIANKDARPSEACEIARLKAITGKPAHPNTKAAIIAFNQGNKHAARHLYVAIDKDGMRHFVGSEMTEFCKKHSLDQARMRTLAKGDPLRKSHKGWTCFNPKGARVPQLANLKE